MKEEIVKRLLSINRGFYQSFADPFRATRGRLQPGVARALEAIPLDGNILDLGCGHGLLADALAERRFSGVYVGLDSSQPLLDAVSPQLRAPHYQFARADLAEDEWSELARFLLHEGAPVESSDAVNNAHFDWVFAFSVLHHIPTKMLRRSMVEASRSLLDARGRMAVSVWDFLSSPRFQDRLLPWESQAIHADEVDAGDYLIDWREGGNGVRYVHHFAEGDLTRLAIESGFRVSQEFRSDGENGRLGIYQIWEGV